MHNGLKKLLPLYYENNILKFNNMISFEITKFMLDFNKNKLPNYFNDYFCKTSQVHTWFTLHS